MYWALGWMILAAGGAEVAIVKAIHHATHGLVVGSTFCALGLVGAVLNYRLGRGCRAFVVTDVQTLRLPGFCRLRRGRRVLARLEEAIRAAQGDPAP